MRAHICVTKAQILEIHFYPIVKDYAKKIKGLLSLQLMYSQDHRFKIFLLFIYYLSINYIKYQKAEAI